MKTRNLVIGCSAGLAAVIAAALCCFLCLPEEGLPASGQKVIQYVEFNPTYAALDRALAEDIRAHEDGEERDWIDTLSYLGAKYGGDFSRYQAKDMDALFQALDEGETMEALTEKMEHYDYYREAYGAVLDGLVGEYREEKEQDGQTVWQDCYGLKAFFPLAKNFAYEHYNDFGARRTYGYTRPHLGHDMMAATVPRWWPLKAAWWRLWAGINTGAGASAFAAARGGGIIITPIFVRIDPLLRGWKKASRCRPGR